MQKENEKKIRRFMATIIVFSGILFFRFFAYKVDALNATMLAFSYKYGFISRGLLGSIYQLMDQILPFDMINYTWVYRFMFAATMGFYFILFLFFYVCLKHLRMEALQDGKYLIILLTVTAVPTFCGRYNFGRMDIFCIMLSLIGAMLLIMRKLEWLLIPISAFGVMFHQGNVFMFFNIILVLLICRAIESEGKERRKYIILFGVSFCVASVLFLWFELFSHGHGAAVYEEVVANAKLLSEGGGYHADVVDKEILGIDLTEREIGFHVKNFVQFPIFIVLMLPYIICGFHFFKCVIKAAETKLDKWKYIMVAIGAGTILPDLLLKVDYGRWMFAIICYYLVVILSLAAMQDQLIILQLRETAKHLNKYPQSPLLLIYPLLFQPFEATDICYLVANIADFLNSHFLHLWI